MSRLLLLCICLGSFSIMYAQGLKEEAAFFHRQADVYQSWLDSRGMGKYLNVRELDIQENEVALYLEFPFQDTDSIVRTWDKLKALAEKDNGLSLEEQLFYKMVFFMELRQGAANVQLYDTYDLRKEPLFFRGIYFDVDQQKVLVESSDPKSQIEEINIPVSYLKPQAGQQGETVGITKREELFNKIESYAKAKYTQKTCESRTPKFEPIVNNKELRFRVVDLCRVVLKDNTSGSICSILNSLGFSCDNSVREMLEFTFSIKEQGTSQATLHILIDGKFGSGYFREVSRGAYQEMEKEPRFESYIEEFSDNFASDLVRYLK